MRIGVAVLAGLLLFAACSGGSAGTTPQATFESMKKVAGAKDWGGLYDLVEPSAREEAEKNWQEQKKKLDSPEGKMGLKMMAGMFGLDAEKIPEMSMKELFVAMLEKFSDMPQGKKVQEFAEATILDTKIDGDKATIKFKAGGKEDSMNLKKVGGSWYLDGSMLRGMSGGM